MSELPSPVEGPVGARPPASSGTGRGVLTTLVGGILPPATVLVAAPLLARVLGVEGRGETAAAVAPFLLAVTCATVGVPEAVTYFAARRPHLARTIFRRGARLVTLGGVLSTALVIALAPLLSGGSSTMQRLITIAALPIVPTLLLMTLRARAMAAQRFAQVARDRATGAVLTLGALVAFTAAGSLTPTAAVVIMTCGPLTGAVAHARPRAPAPEEAPGEPGVSRAVFLRFGVSAWAGAVTGIALLRLDQVILVPLSTTAELGIYAVAVTIGEAPLILNAAIRDVMFARESTEPSAARLTTAARVSGALVTGAAAALAALSPWLLPVLFGEAFRPAVGPALVMLAGIALSAAGSVAGSGLTGRGRPGLRSACLAVACAVNVVLLILLAPPLGALGAAIATAVGGVVASNAAIVLVCRLEGLRWRDFAGIRAGDLRIIRRDLTSVAGAVGRRVQLVRIIVSGYARWLPTAARNRTSRASLLGDGPVVSLTTFGARAHTVHLTIESIGRGAVRPRRLILWVDEASVVAAPGPGLERARRRGLEILPCPDLGPHKKYAPYVTTGAPGPLVTADDDVLYPRSWLRDLARAHAAAPELVLCHRAHRMLVAGQAAPYATWPLCRDATPGFTVFPTGVSGVLYPDRMLDALREAGTGFVAVAPRADDVWLHSVAVRTRTMIRQLTARPRLFPVVPRTQAGALMQENVQGGRNDRAIAAVYSPSDLAAVQAETVGR
jgi:O-antigen/teichoic acid export membrane protein